MSSALPIANPITNMTTIDYSSIKNVSFSFSNLLLNATASDYAHDYDDFFDESGVVLDPDLLDIINAEVSKLLHLCDGQPARIPSIMNKFYYKFFSQDAGQTIRLRTQSNIEQAFQETLRRNETVVKIIVMCESLHFHPGFNGNNIDLIFTTNEEMMTQVTQQSVLPSPAGNAPASLPPSFTQPLLHVPTNEFRHNLLPPDVKKRYDDHQDPDVIVPVCNLVHFVATSFRTHPCKYFYQPNIASEKVIVRNGAVLASYHDSKNFHKTVPYCLDSSWHGIRSWYQLFSRHGNANGIYIVPYELLTQGHGGGQGFAFDDDLPPHKSGYFPIWSNDILRALQHSSMFPPGSKPAERVMTMTDGYNAILAVLHDSHPAFVTHPITLCKNWPEQKSGQSIFQFYAEFVEAISLRAIFLDGTQDLNSPVMLSTFMQNCTHSAFLIASARLDRIDPSTSHMMSPGNLALTLSNYLARSDSPSQLAKQHSPSPSSSRFGEGLSPRFRSTARPFPRRVNALGEEEDPNYDAEFESAMDEHMPALIRQLQNEGPTLRHCMFCGVGQMHLFDQCPIFTDTAFLKSFAIRVGSAYQGTLAAAFKRQKESRGVVDPPPRPNLAARIHQVFSAAETEPAPVIPDFLSADFIPGQQVPDFP
jgi:hypothetical protein